MKTKEQTIFDKMDKTISDFFNEADIFIKKQKQNEKTNRNSK